MVVNFIYKGCVTGTSSKTNEKYYRVDYTFVCGNFSKDYSFFLRNEEEFNDFLNYIEEVKIQNIEPILLDNIVTCYHSQKLNNFRFGIDTKSI